jgi:hypothetical protein
MVVFIGVGASAVVHRNFMVSVLSALLAIACCAGVYFASIILRHLPNMHRQLTDYERRRGMFDSEDDVN